MRSLLASILVLALLGGSSALAGTSCKSGELVSIDGKVSRAFKNENDSWTVVIGQLKDASIVACNIAIGIHGEESSSGPWMLTEWPVRPPSCRKGANVRATVELVEDPYFGILLYETKGLVCY